MDMTASTDRVLLVGRDEIPQLVVLDKAERISWTIIIPPGQDYNCNIRIELNHPECEVDIAAAYVCKNSERISINIDMRHNAPMCRSRQEIRGIVDGHARASFDGLIYVKRDSGQTKAYQECHSILLSESACAEAKPQLEIYADDVECSHGATSGFLDKQQLFYMRARGIDEAEAKALQLQAFLAPVLSRLPEELRDEYYSML